MFGVVDGVYICNTERTEELSRRMYERNIPSEPLKPAFSPRPEQTKFTVLGKEKPQRKNMCHDMMSKTYPNFNPETIFNPGNAQAPWYGFASNVNTESSLRNQFFALQDCNQAKYIPSTKSDLYEVKVTSQPMPMSHPHPHLFRKDDFEPFQPNTLGVAKQLFHNHTQQQLKNC
jgi:hypothetical protein